MPGRAAAGTTWREVRVGVGILAAMVVAAHVWFGRGSPVRAHRPTPRVVYPTDPAGFARHVAGTFATEPRRVSRSCAHTDRAPCLRCRAPACPACGSHAGGCGAALVVLDGARVSATVAA